ncbi:MAG: dTDP-4-dehydrorhamnose reductase family protein [Vicinamibacterales bacterium]
MLILGATGMLGSCLARQWPARFTTLVPAPRRAGTVPPAGATTLATPLEAADPSSLDRVVREAAPDVVVNCVAATPGAASFGDAEAMVALNALFPHQVAARLPAGARLIQISTDAVFSGRRGGYRETDATDPVDLYGRAKLAGEVEGPGCLNVRTSFYGRSPRGAGLIEWLAASGGQTIDGYVDYVFSGIAAPVLADVLGDLVERPTEGVLHVGGPPVSKFDLLTAAARALAVDVRIRPVERGRIDRSLDSSRLHALRPAPLPALDAMMGRIAMTPPAERAGQGRA